MEVIRSDLLQPVFTGPFSFAFADGQVNYEGKDLRLASTGSSLIATLFFFSFRVRHNDDIEVNDDDHGDDDDNNVCFAFLGLILSSLLYSSISFERQFTRLVTSINRVNDRHHSLSLSLSFSCSRSHYFLLLLLHQLVCVVSSFLLSSMSVYFVCHGIER